MSVKNVNGALSGPVGRSLTIIMVLVLSYFFGGPAGTVAQTPARIGESGIGSGSWNPKVPCNSPWIVRISDITDNMTGVASLSNSRFSPGITENPPVSGSLGAKRWLTPGATPPGWHSPGPSCTITDSKGQTVASFVEIDGVTYGGLTYEDCRTNYDAVNGGSTFPAGHWCDDTSNLIDPAMVPNISPSCSSATDPTCYGKIHIEFDGDWLAAGYCGISSATCNNRTLAQQIKPLSATSLIDVQGFVYWDPDHITTQWHSFSGWELHPFTAWRPHQTSSSGGDFSVSANPSSITTVESISVSSTITLTSLNNFAGTIRLSTFVSPNGPTVTLSSTSISLSAGGSASSTVHFQSSAIGNYTVTVTGTSGTITHSVPIRVTVRPSSTPYFTVTTTPSSLSEVAGQSSSSTVKLTSINAFNGPVSLSASVSAGGFDVQINPNNPTLIPGGTSTSTLTIRTPNNAAFANYTVTLTATNGGITQTVGLPLTVTGFAVAINPGDASFPANAHSNFDLALESLNGFTGNVTLSDQVSNNQLHASLTSNVVKLQPGEVVVTLLNVDSSVQGTYSVSVAATHGALAKKVSATVDVTTNRDFIISADPLFATVSLGSSASSTITVASVNGLSGNINLKANTNPAGPTVSISPATLNVVSGGVSTSKLTISVPVSAHVGLYSIPVTGKSGPTHTVTLWLFVVRPDFAISAEPSSQTVTPGGSTNYNLTLTSLNGFSGSITLSSNSQLDLSSSLVPTVVTLSSAGSATTTISISTTSSSAPGTYTFTITATQGTLVHVKTITITVD